MIHVSCMFLVRCMYDKTSCTGWVIWTGRSVGLVARRLVYLHRIGASFLQRMDIRFGVLPIPTSFRSRVTEGRINTRLPRRPLSLLLHHTFRSSFAKMNTANLDDFAGLAFPKTWTK